MNDLTPIPPQQPSAHYSDRSSLIIELAKCLKLVAPISMAEDAQKVWLQAGVDALEDIRADEVAAVSLEVRRSITRPSQIIPEIAKLVGEKRKWATNTNYETDPACVAAMIGHRLAEGRMNRIADAKEDEEKIRAAYDWEREERKKNGLAVCPDAKPFTRAELDHMSPRIASLGVKLGYLKREGGRLVEA